jgi:hypothetical protein
LLVSSVCCMVCTGAAVGTEAADGTLVLRTAPLAVVEDKAWSRSRLELLKKGDCSAIVVMLHSMY